MTRSFIMGVEPQAFPGYDTPIDMTVSGATSLGRTPDGDHDWLPAGMVVRTAAGTSLLGAVVVSIGTNSPNYNNIATVTLTGLTSGDLGRVFPFGVNSTVPIIPANTEVFVNVTTIGVGSGMMYVDVEGRQIP